MTTKKKLDPEVRRTRSVKFLNSTWEILERNAQRAMRPWTNYLERLVVEEDKRAQKDESTE